MQIIIKNLHLLVAASVGVVMHQAAAAVELAPGLELRGYGHVAVRREAISAETPAAVEHDVSLLAAVALGERVRLWAQVAHLSETGRLRLDLMFLDWELSPQTTVRIGQARLPVGLYNETRDVQALRASANLPLLYGGDSASLDEGFRGVVVEHRLGSGLLGSLTIEAFAAWAVSPDVKPAELARLGGGRFSWATPWPALTVKLSGYSGYLRTAHSGAAGARPREQALVGSLQYEGRQWSFNAEAARLSSDDHRQRVAYAEAIRQLSPQWRAFVRAEYVRDEDVSSQEAVRQRKRLAVGAAWNASEHWGLRVEAARNSGRPEQLPASVTLDTARQRWNDARVSVNYLF